MEARRKTGIQNAPRRYGRTVRVVGVQIFRLHPHGLPSLAELRGRG